MASARWHDLRHVGLAVAGLAIVTTTFGLWLRGASTSTIALSYLLLVLFVATIASRAIAVATSLAAMLAIDFFFLPPLYRFTVDDPQNWVDLFTFLAVSLVASHLSTTARARQREAQVRSDELARLFEVSRDILRDSESAGSLSLVTRHIALRFRLGYAAICLATNGSFTRYETGRPEGGVTLTDGDLRAGLDLTHFEDSNQARARGLRPPVDLAPLRRGGQAVGVLALSGAVDVRTRDVLVGLIETAIERIHFLEEREQARLAQRSAELKSTLLASLAHDLGTPLTSIRVGVTNICWPSASESTRAAQGEVVLAELNHLNELFQNIFEMTRIDAGSIASQPEWVHPAEIVEAAIVQVRRTLGDHDVTVTDRAREQLVRIDPRLTALALSRLLENAAQYSPKESLITIVDDVTPDGVLLTVCDQGPGIAAADLPHLFDRFYRGASEAERRPGTGMGLAIARGLLAAQAGRVWADNLPEGGAQFSILVPAAAKGPEKLG